MATVYVNNSNANSLTLENSTTYILYEDILITNQNGFGGNNLSGVVFDGNGHIIVVNVNGFNGLFGSGASSSVEGAGPGIIVKNLTVLPGTNISLGTGASWFFKAGTSSSPVYGRIENCKSTGDIENESGGFFGKYNKGYIIDSYSTGRIGYASGGIFGGYAQTGSVIERCFSTGVIGYGGNNSSGGLCGWYANGVTIRNSFVSGAIVYSNNGRAVGNNSSNITVQNFYSSSAPSQPSFDNGLGIGISTPSTGVLLQNSWSDSGANSVLVNDPRVWYSNATNTPYVFVRDYVPRLATFTVGGADILSNSSTTLPFTNSRDVAATAVSGTVSSISHTTLSVGITTVTATVTDAGKSQTYERTVTIQGSTAATITVNGTMYTGQVNVTSDVSSVTIGATLVDSLATVTGTGVKSLNTGLNTFTVTVNGQHGSTENYTVVVKRKSAATTATITINETVVTSGSTVNLPYGTASVAVDVSNVAVGATYTVTGGSELTTGSNTVTVVVTAEDTTYTQTYTFTVNVAEASSNKDFTLNVANSNGYLMYSYDTTNAGSTIFTMNNMEGIMYTISSSDNVATSVTVSSGLTDASGYIYGFIQGNTYYLYILATSQDGTSSTTTITLRVKSTDNSLSEFKINDTSYLTEINTASPTIELMSRENFTFTIFKANSNATFNDPSSVLTFDSTGTYVWATAEEISRNFSFTLTSENGDVRTYTFTVTRPAEQTKQSQTITFAAIADKAIGNSVTLNAMASSGLAVEYDITSVPVEGVFTIGQGDTIQLVGAGSVTVTAKQLGNGTYSAATNVVRTFTVSKKAQVITVPPMSVKAVGSVFNLNASATSGLALNYVPGNSEIISINTATGQVTALAAGTTTITVSQSGNDEWNFTAQTVNIIVKDITSSSALGAGSLPLNEEVPTIISGVPAVAKKQARATNGSVSYAPADTSIMPVTVSGLPSSIADVSIATSAPVSGVVKFVVDAHTDSGDNIHDFTASPLTLTFTIPSVTVQTWFKIEKRSAQTGNIENTYTVKSAADGTVVLSNVKSLCEFTASPTTEPLACFPAGTKILTSAGYKAVETLCASDRVVTADGRSVAFKLYKTVIAKATKETAPFVIKAGAFGRSSPAADIKLSPLHAIQSAKGVWQIPKCAAVENSGVRQYGIGEAVTYYHVELPNYFTDNIIAEGGVVVESFGAKQCAGMKNVFKYNARIGGFTRAANATKGKAAVA